MELPPDDLDRDELRLRDAIDHELRELRRLLEAEYIRVWRYVDSQKVIFGFRWLGPNGEDRTESEGFGNCVGFARQEPARFNAFHAVTLKDGEHPYWYFPEFDKLKPSAAGFIEAVLARGDKHELDGLVCAGTSAASWGSIQLNRDTTAAIAARLSKVQSLIQLYSLQRFHSAFIVDGEAHWWPQSSKIDFAQPQTPQRILAALAESLDRKASFYLRNPRDLTLYAGIGDFYDELKFFEDPDGANALANPEYRQSLFSGYAMRDARSDDREPMPVLFPGSPDVETYNGLRSRIQKWVEIVQELCRDKPALEQRAQRLSSDFDSIGTRGSFGVFPVWAQDVRDVQAFLCVASMERNFFRWRARIAIQDACQLLSHDLPSARPLRNLLHRVGPQIGTQLRIRKDFRGELLPVPVAQTRDRIRRRRRTDRGSTDDVYIKTLRAFVMSVDVRHSTQLMRDTVKPEEYAAFLTNLSREMADEVMARYGVFDKFTGDGILAFFPVCVFDDDPHPAALWTISAAERCHDIFGQLFETLRPHLAIVESPQGLGIGIDFGDVSLVDVSGELTVVGSPVVYACRLGAAPAGHTLLNEQAYKQVRSRHGCGDFEELVLPTKDRNIRARVVPRHWSQENALPREFFWTKRPAPR